MTSNRPIHPGHAILVNLGIDAKDVTAFTIECQSRDHVPTITLKQVVFNIPEPTFVLTTREVTSVEPVQSDSRAEYALNEATARALLAVHQVIHASTEDAKKQIRRDFLCARERFCVLVRKHHLEQAGEKVSDWDRFYFLTDPEPFYFRRSPT